MALKIWREWRFPIEFALLLALLFFLPLREAPKNLFWLAYVVTWLVNRIRSGEWGGHWDGWDSLIVAWLASGYLAAAFAGIRTIDANEWSAVNDLVRNLSTLLFVKRAGYSRAQKMLLLSMLAASCVLAGAEAWWRWKVTHARRALELVSVGHVNHSAIYMAICAGVVVGLAMALWRGSGVIVRAALATAIGMLLSWLFMTESRAAVFCVIPMLFILVAVGTRAAGFGSRGWAALGLLIVIGIGVGGGGVVVRQVEHTATNNMLAERDLIWNRAIVASRAHPWFGTGMDNFSRISDDLLQSWLAERNQTYDASAYRRAPHAHNLYLNVLAERGVVGLGVLLVILCAWAWRLLKRLPPEGDFEALALWSASFSGLFVTAVVGLVNTTLHHEHAMLALVVLALFIAREQASA